MSKGFPSAFEIEHRLRDMIRGDRIPVPPDYIINLTDVSLTNVPIHMGPGSQMAPPCHERRPETPISDPSPTDPSEPTA
jgi:hypothetical protein